MSIVRIDPFRGFDGLARKMNNIIDDFDKGFKFEYGNFLPKIDISEDETSLYIHAEMAGIKKEDVKVSINDDNLLIIKGKKEKEHKDGENDENNNRVYLRMERSYGEFTRSFQLPENIDNNSISAKYTNGILNITLTKKEQEKPKEKSVVIE
jgi:HSP20 family protein